MKKRLMTAFMIAILYGCMMISMACAAHAQTGSIKLLAVSETPEGLVGSMADLSLEIKKGTGRVFIDTLPASKLDTQMTTRFARDMACRYSNVDCSKSDFFYTITADSPIVGGPSAGAATALLTISLLKKIYIDESIAITGTINSGYLLGSVGGVNHKIDAAADYGLTKVVIPETDISFTENNVTIDYVDYGKQRNITVVRAADIDSALYEFTGKTFRESKEEVKIIPSYTATMALLAEELCNRSMMMQDKVMQHSLSKDEDKALFNGTFSTTKERSGNLTLSGLEAYNKGKYYSSASYCFGSNVNYQFLLLKTGNLTKGQMTRLIESTDDDINELRGFLRSYQIETITDLQAKTVSMERVLDARDYLNSSINSFREGDDDGVFMNLAYAIERTNSAKSWSRFLGTEGKEFSFNEEDMMRSCISKINEAEEYFQYIQLIFPGLMERVGEDIAEAENDYKNEDYDLCLNKASLAKAEVSIVLSTIGFNEDNLNKLLDMKLNAAKKAIVEEQQNGIFPIVGYSYYEYAESLRNDSIYSALLYAEYSLELSSLDIYFKPKKISMLAGNIEFTLIFVLGVVFGMIVMRILMVSRKKDPAYVPPAVKLPTPKHKRIKFDFSRK